MQRREDGTGRGRATPPPFPLPNTTDGGGLEVLVDRVLLSTPPGGRERNNAAQPRLICTCSVLFFGFFFCNRASLNWDDWTLFNSDSDFLD